MTIKNSWFEVQTKPEAIGMIQMRVAVTKVIAIVHLTEKVLVTNAKSASLNIQSFSETKECSSKMLDKWIHCDMCVEWFHLICLPQNVDPEDVCLWKLLCRVLMVQS